MVRQGAGNTGCGHREKPLHSKDFMQNHNLSFTVLLDIKQDVAKRYNITGIPTTFFIDKDGIIQDKVIGAFQNKTQIENRVSKIIP